MEVGNIVFSHVVQKGYVKADGQELYREDYPLLFQFAQENELLLGEEEWANNRQGMYSFGDGHMTFRVPDLRGEFLRVLDDGRGLDVGRRLGSAQGDTIRNITGEMKNIGGGHAVYPSGTGSFHTPGKKAPQNFEIRFTDSPGVVSDFTFDASRVVPTAAENRPKNIALIAQIKY